MTTTTSGAKMSMLGAKCGFVIPKNKLSGSLIPSFQRLELPIKRKTKWGPDFTQDTSVKKARVLAYQKRLDQITHQLESGTLEAATSGDSASDIAQHLEFEKRQAIGEILDLNPRYKAPPDYKPLLKEATLPIHVKEYSDFSFLSLIFGSQGDTQKRLEKETGAKVQIFGTKSGGEKAELSPSDENMIHTLWKELYFQISSDTYEKVDAAIAVIELLISSVSGNTGAGSAPSSKSEEISAIPGNSNATTTDPSSDQPTDSSVQPLQSQFQKSGSSFPLASSQVPFGPPLNLSAPGFGNHNEDKERPTNSMNRNPLFAQQPLRFPHNASLLPDSQVPGPPDLFSYSVVSPQGSLAPYSGSQIQPIGPRSTMRPSALLTSQPVPSSVFRPTLLPDIVSGHIAQSVRPLVPNFSPHPVVHQQGTKLPSSPFPSNINLNHRAEYAPGGSLHPMSISAHISSRPASSFPNYPTTNPPTNSAPRPFHGDFGFPPQQSNISQISPRPSSQSAHLAFQSPPQHFGQSFTRSQHFGRQMDQPPNHPPALFHGNVRSSSLQNFGPPLPPMVSRNFPGAEFSQHSAHFPPRPVFNHDNLIPSGQPQVHHRFNTGVHQVYDPFSPSDA